jgi:hypothetical protein
MQLAVTMLPVRLPSVLASVPNSIMPHMTPKTTVYVKDFVSDGRHVSNVTKQSGKSNSQIGVSVPMEKRR